MRWRVFRSGLPHLLFATVIAVAQPAPLANAQPQVQPKKVLVLYSTRRDGEFSKVGENDLPRLLDEGLGRNLDYYSEFIDRARIPDPSYQAAFRDFLRVKYGGVRFDLVMAMQDVAANFVGENRDGLFPKTPIVVLTNNPGWMRIPNATGLVNPRNFTSTLTFMRQLQPDVENVFVVTGAGISDREYENAVKRQVQSSKSPLNIVYLSGLATPALRNRLSQLPRHSAVYYVLVNQDGSGALYHPLEYVDRVAAMANAPTYSWVDSAMGRGIVGGSLYVQRSVIERVGALALRVLRGEKPDDIPVSLVNSNLPQVDWRQLRRWGIDESQTPAGTLVRFRIPTVWDQYGNYIVAVAAVLLTQTTLILGLLLHRRRRRRAEDQLRASQGELRKSYERIRDLGARLLQAQETERSRIAGELHDDICQRMLLLTIELECLMHADGSKTAATKAMSMAQDISKSLNDLSRRLHPMRLELVGLVAALDQLCREVSRAGLAVKFTHENVPSTLVPDVMLCLFRIVQEALGNAIKYSGATEVSVRLAAGPAGLLLDIIDNGRGFDVEAAWSTGLGLVSMTERSEAMGGSLEISSKPGAGTSITARIPGSYRAAETTILVA
jgi:signal transduction histidine kinase